MLLWRTGFQLCPYWRVYMWCWACHFSHFPHRVTNHMFFIFSVPHTRCYRMICRSAAHTHLLLTTLGAELWTQKGWYDVEYPEKSDPKCLKLGTETFCHNLCASAPCTPKVIPLQAPLGVVKIDFLMLLKQVDARARSTIENPRKSIFLFSEQDLIMHQLY